MKRNKASIEIQQVAIFNLDHIKSNYFQTDHSDITNAIIIDYFLTHSYIALAVSA